MSENDELLKITLQLTDERYGTGTEAEAMSDLERTLGDALKAAGAGYCDGNEIGMGTRVMLFYGPSAVEMWRVLEPIMTQSPRRSSALVEMQTKGSWKSKLLG